MSDSLASHPGPSVSRLPSATPHFRQRTIQDAGCSGLKRMNLCEEKLQRSTPYRHFGVYILSKVTRYSTLIETYVHMR